MEGNEKPTINLRYLNYKRSKRVILPPNSTRNHGNTSHSMHDEGSYFRNAKAASRAENGLKLAVSSRLGLGTKGILEEYDGPSIKVEVIRDIHVNPFYIEEYTFRDENGKVYNKEYNDRFSGWDFYNFIEPVPFVPRKTNAKARKTRKSKRKSTQVQRK